MGLRINTNIDAQYAVMNLNNTNNKLSESLNRLSTGLRITKAADDAAGMTIADSLKFQSMNLGQAINNGNNAIKLIQIADMALQKSIDIVQTVAQKATQAANATEDDASRQALQSDIDKLVEELNNIAETTSYKGVNLLDGTFTNKAVQVGAYMNQTLSIGAQRTAADSIGWVANETLKGMQFATAQQSSAAATTLQYNDKTYMVELKKDGIDINGVDVANKTAGINAQQQIDAKTLAAAINSVKEQTGGVEATAETTVKGTTAITGGTISAGTFVINGVNIGEVKVGAGDANGALVDAINKFTDQTGVVASVNDQGKLVLTAQDGRNIAVETNENAKAITGLATAEATTTGTKTTISTGMTFRLNGVSITLGDNTTAAAAATKINNTLASAGITASELRASTTAGGYLTLKAADGRDINIYVSNAQAAASHLDFIGLASSTAGHSTYFLTNDSNHGKITLTSTDNIQIKTSDSSLNSMIGVKNDNTIISPNNNLEDVNVKTQKGAELAIKIAQSALSNLDKVRSNLGSVQNQIQATVENISVTQININGAESTIRDVNFAKESSNYSKLQILAQSGTYALAQANAVQQNVLRLLQ